jgi:hypothetical protein
MATTSMAHKARAVSLNLRFRSETSAVMLRMI